MKTKHIIIVALVATVFTLTSCEKVSLAGVLMAGTAVEDRVKMSYEFYQINDIEEKLDYDLYEVKDGYTFLVGSDSHLTNDTGRLEEMLKIGMDNNDLLYIHLGDIADTKVEYYINLENMLRAAQYDYVNKYYQLNTETGLYYRKGMENPVGRSYESIRLPFFPVVN